MQKERFEAKRRFAGPAVPSMKRRKVGHDYSAPGIYMVTMVTGARRPLLGRVCYNPETLLTPAREALCEYSRYGRLVKDCFENTPSFCPQVRILKTTLMPDHLHGILQIKETLSGGLGRIISGFKAATRQGYRFLNQTGPLPPHSMLPERGEFGKERIIAHSGLVKERGEFARERGEFARGVAITALGFLSGAELWEDGYHDYILGGSGTLGRWFRYLDLNPLRRALKETFPDFFRVRFDLDLHGERFAAIGNRFLLDAPVLKQLKVSRSVSEGELERLVRHWLEEAASGTVLVSPGISPGEKLVLREVLERGYRAIFIATKGFDVFSKPGTRWYDACAEGRWLSLSDRKHANGLQTLTREDCLYLNELARRIANG